MKRARQSLFPLRKLKRFGMGPEILKRFYSCNREHPDRMHHSLVRLLLRIRPQSTSEAQYITGAKLPAIQDLYSRRCQRKTLKIVKDPSHPSHRLFDLLLHGKRYRSAKSRRKRLQQFLPPSNKTPEQVTKWLPRLFALCAPQPLFLCCCYSLFIIYTQSL